MNNKKGVTLVALITMVLLIIMLQIIGFIAL